MYSDIEGIQIFLYLFKAYNIKKFVISPGTRNTPLVHSIEGDNFFECYSCVDERSAGFLALGLSETFDEPVCVTCTAATATCNYMAAIKEANERNIQLIALTADQEEYSKFHMGSQNINQTNMYTNYVRYAVDVPKITNAEDYWYFNRCVNEALMSLTNSKGPIQINYRMNYSLESLSYFPEREIKKTRVIKKYDEKNINWTELAKDLKSKKIIVFCGSNYYNNDNVKKQILCFKHKTNSVIFGDLYSNIIDNEVINPSIIGEIYKNKNIKQLRADIIIMLGSVIYSPIKNNKSLFGKGTKTWQISPNGILNDGFKNVNKIFKITPELFFQNINKYIENEEEKNFYDMWKNMIEKVKFPNLEFTNFSCIVDFINKIPNNSLLHMSVLDAIRISNYTRLPNNVKCFANIGADGIDGALSTFLGQSTTLKNDLSFLIIGDLSLMYDMNALYNNLNKNIRILVINNYAGAEFHKNFGIERIPSLNKHIAAGHSTCMKDVVSINNNIKYLSATNKDEFCNSLNEFTNKGDKPIILEVFTDAQKDAKKLKEFWKINMSKFLDFKGNILNFIINRLNPNTKEKLKKIYKNIKK